MAILLFLRCQVSSWSSLNEIVSNCWQWWSHLHAINRNSLAGRQVVWESVDFLSKCSRLQPAEIRFVLTCFAKLDCELKLKTKKGSTAWCWMKCERLYHWFGIRSWSCFVRTKTNFVRAVCRIALVETQSEHRPNNGQITGIFSQEFIVFGLAFTSCFFKIFHVVSIIQLSIIVFRQLLNNNCFVSGNSPKRNFELARRSQNLSESKKPTK